MNEIKPLTIEETALKEEMKNRCLNKGQYIDEKAEDKFKMLCHLEDFEIQYWELKDNWNKLKEWLEEEIKDSLNTWGEVYPRDTYKNVLEQMQEIEGGMNE
jgi:hypothetical protein